MPSTWSFYLIPQTILAGSTALQTDETEAKKVGITSQEGETQIQGLLALTTEGPLGFRFYTLLLASLWPSALPLHDTWYTW